MHHITKFSPILTLLAITTHLVACSQPPPATAAPQPNPTKIQQPPTPFSYNAYADLLAKHVNNKGNVNYKELLKNRKSLDQFTATMATIPQKTYTTWDHNTKLALWINAYNAYTLTAIIDHYPIQTGSIIARLRFPKNSIRQIPGVWDELKWTVAGEKHTLEEIEHKILRKRFADEPRVHMAIVCASISCPPLRNEPFLPQKLDTQLTDQTKQFLADPGRFNIDRDKNIVNLSPIFSWFADDFTEKYHTDAFPDHPQNIRPVLNFVSQHLNQEDAAYLKSQQYTTDFQSYDWGLNEQN